MLIIYLSSFTFFFLWAWNAFRNILFVSRYLFFLSIRKNSTFFRQISLINLKGMVRIGILGRRRVCAELIFGQAERGTRSMRWQKKNIIEVCRREEEEKLSIVNHASSSSGRELYVCAQAPSDEAYERELKHQQERIMRNLLVVKEDYFFSGGESWSEEIIYLFFIILFCAIVIRRCGWLETLCCCLLTTPWKILN